MKISIKNLIVGSGFMWLLALPMAAMAQDATTAETAPAETTSNETAPTDGVPEAVGIAPSEEITPPVEETATVTEEAPVQEAVAEEAPAEEAVAESSWWPEMDFSWGGFLRSETALSTSNYDNPDNQLGNTFNGRSVARQAYVPPALGTVIPGLPGAVDNWTSVAITPPLASDGASPGLRGTTNDNASGGLSGQALQSEDNQFNYQVIRGELEFAIKFGQDLALLTRIRGIYDPTIYDDFDAGIHRNTQGGISGGDPRLYQGKPNYLQYIVEGDDKPNPLEWAGSDYLVYLPTLVLDYNSGPVNLRIGNQQIAWGQALFFRVFDVVDGLDLRRHLVLDYAQEEYSDERVPALGIRLSYQFTDELLADGFVQKFQPSIYPNPNTTYNVIPVQFTVHDLYSKDGYDEKLNYGIRLKGNYGQMGFQAMYTQRYNPDGVFRWTESGVRKGLAGTTGTLGATTSLLYSAKAPAGAGACNPSTCRLYGDIAEALSHTPFEASYGGVYSAAEWFSYAARVRLDGINGLNASITEFPASQDVYASAVPFQTTCNDTSCEAYNQLNTFFIAAGGSLRGHIAREYKQEDVFSLGASYVTEGEPGGIFDQLIINLESSYIPNRTFTNTSLSRNYIEKESSVTALVLEKYYRFSSDFPATYFVMQYMHRNVDDLFGRLLSGYGGTPDGPALGTKNADYYVFAFQQPWPQDIWRAGFATLYDPRGSILVQPGIRWKPASTYTIEAFYTYVDGSIGNANPNNTLLSTIDYADELSLRLTYQF